MKGYQQMMGSIKTLYSAKQAAAICGIDDIPLQIVLDRKYFENFTTVVPQGNRTYRMFDERQLFFLYEFLRMCEDGIKPSTAKLYIEAMDIELFSAETVFSSGPKVIVFRNGVLSVIEKHQLLDPRSLRGYVIDYEGDREAINHELKNIGQLDSALARKEARAVQKS